VVERREEEEEVKERRGCSGFSLLFRGSLASRVGSGGLHGFDLPCLASLTSHCAWGEVALLLVTGVWETKELLLAM
jgi:hypothetical protein